MSDATCLSRFAEFLADLSFRDLPHQVIDQTKIVLRHNMLMALAARPDAIPGQDDTAWPDGLAADRSATRLTDGRRAPDEQAVLTNSLAMGARAQHDEQQDSICHFGSTVIPPLLAAAEQTGAGGREVLTAIVAGYEVGARLGALSVVRVTERGLRPTGLFGPIAGAAAVGKLLGLDVERLTSAMAIAANTSAGLMQTWVRGTDEWRYQTAHAARNGFVSAKLARAGVVGAPDTIEGARGFHAAFVGNELSIEQVFAGIGHRWAIDRVLLKPYPVCALNQAPVQQLLGLQRAHNFSSNEVQQIRVRMHPADLEYPGVDTTSPARTRAAALMNLRTCLAISVLERDVPLASLDAPDAEQVTDLMKRIVLVRDAGVPRHESVVEVAGAALNLVSGPPAGVRYDARTLENLVAGLQPLTGLGTARLASVMAKLAALDRESSLSSLVELIRPEGPA